MIPQDWSYDTSLVLIWAGHDYHQPVSPPEWAGWSAVLIWVRFRLQIRQKQFTISEVQTNTRNKAWTCSYIPSDYVYCIYMSMALLSTFSTLRLNPQQPLNNWAFMYWFWLYVFGLIYCTSHEIKFKWASFCDYITSASVSMWYIYPYSLELLYWYWAITWWPQYQWSNTKECG